MRREEDVKPARPVLLRKLIEINARTQRVQREHLPRRERGKQGKDASRPSRAGRPAACGQMLLEMLQMLLEMLQMLLEMQGVKLACMRARLHACTAA